VPYLEKFWLLKKIWGDFLEALLERNPVMTFPIKKRINTDLFIDRKVAL